MTDVAEPAVENSDLLAKLGDLSGQFAVALVGHLQPVQQRLVGGSFGSQVGGAVAGRARSSS